MAAAIYLPISARSLHTSSVSQVISYYTPHSMSFILTKITVLTVLYALCNHSLSHGMRRSVKRHWTLARVQNESVGGGGGGGGGVRDLV